MAKTSRPKYKCKNVGEYKIIRRCTHKEGCNEYGIVSYRNDPPSGGVKVEFRCIAHVHKEKEKDTSKTEVAENGYRTLNDPTLLLSLNHYNTTRKVWKH